ncbi:hypothetical protein ACIBG8_39640 [Nonomuraea sp. NPDC050556]|uniref:hypothetical protein n=1 Tax=Nonomuraea sp. NPDC050556 TaxID=3364369 RepID=UPI0037ABE973
MNLSMGCWRLSEAGRLVGEIHVDDSDFPWLLGRFVAQDGYVPWAAVFARELALLEADDLGAEWEQLYDLLNAELDLVDPRGRTVAEFLLHVDSDAGPAWFRWLVEDE